MIKPKLRKGSVSLYDYCMENEDKKYLLDEWNYEKNSELGLGPKDVSYGSQKMVWWICKGQHHYQQAVREKVHGVGCPFCANKQVLEGYNDFASLYPELLSLWNYTKNTIKPNEITKKSGLKVWWKCEKGHEWEATVSHIVDGRRCPYCSNKQVLKGYNDLATTHPDLLKYWDFEKNNKLSLLPSEITAGSSIKVWWKCENNHSWESTINSKKKGHHCPYCSGKLIIKGKTDLETLSPEVLSYWNYEKNSIRPTEIAKNSNLKVWWKCDKGHEWEARVSCIIRGQRCPYCHSRKILKGFNDLATTHPNLLKEWDYDKNVIKPDEIMHGSGKKVWWKCNKGHSWEAVISNRVSGSGCPYCSHKTTKPEAAIFLMLSKTFKTVHHLYKIENTEFDICVEDLKLLIEYDGWLWHKDKREEDSRKNVIARNNGYRFVRIWEYNSKDVWNDIIRLSLDTLYYDMKKGYNFTTLCQIVRIFLNKLYNKDLSLTVPDNLEQKIEEYMSCEKDESNIFVLYPEISKEWHPILNGQLTPKDFTKGSHYKAYWVCKVGHTYQSSVQSRVNGQECPYCSNNKVLAGFNDLATTHPHLIKEFDYEKNDFSPTEIVAGTNKKIWWKCDKGHEWQAKGSSRVKGSGCPYCSGRRKSEE